MASFEEAITARLAAPADLTAQISTRSYDSILPQGTTYPAVTWQVVDRHDERHFRGQHDEFPVTVQVDTWAATAASRRTVADLVRSTMRGWVGLWGGVLVRRAFKDSDFDTIENADDGGSLPYFRNVQRWVVWIRQAETAVT